MVSPLSYPFLVPSKGKSFPLVYPLCLGFLAFVYVLVRGGGLEPPSLSAPGPKPGASANSAILANDNSGYFLVGRTGIEPVTLGLRVPCSTS